MNRRCRVIKRQNERKGEKEEVHRERRIKNVNKTDDRFMRVDVKCACLIGIQHCSSFIVRIYTNKCLPLL